MGAFVYQRKNVERKGTDACEMACKRWACELQSCIATLPVAASTARMDVTVCQVFMDKWNKCCDTIKAGEVQKPHAGE